MNRVSSQQISGANISSDLNYNISMQFDDSRTYENFAQDKCENLNYTKNIGNTLSFSKAE